MGDLQTKSRFLFADTPAVNILFGTELINQHILGILSIKLKVILCDLQPIAILSYSSESTSTILKTDAIESTQLTARPFNVEVTKLLGVYAHSVTIGTVFFAEKVLLPF